MNKFMSKFIKSTLVGSIGLAILGILLFFQSELTIVSISYIIGSILIAIGAIALLKYIKNMSNPINNELDIVYGIVTIVLGIVVISNPKGVASIIPFILGILMIISSATKLEYGLSLRKTGNNIWKSTSIISIITLICGVMLVINPFKGAEFITKVVGILLFIYAILDIISTIRISKTIKDIFNDKQIVEKVPEAVIVEDNTSEEKKQKKKNKKKTKEEDSENKEEE